MITQALSFPIECDLTDKGTPDLFGSILFSVEKKIQTSILSPQWALLYQLSYFYMEPRDSMHAVHFPFNSAYNLL
jgi:hypothetical protein